MSLSPRAMASNSSISSVGRCFSISRGNSAAVTPLIGCGLGTSRANVSCSLVLPHRFKGELIIRSGA
jgi:hypothetical protein